MVIVSAFGQAAYRLGDVTIIVYNVCPFRTYVLIYSFTSPEKNDLKMLDI